MYDVLSLYEEDYDPEKPLICIDEKPKQIIGDKRKSIPMKPGSPEKYDYEYVRNGTANIFMAVEFKAGKRMTLVTNRRTKIDFAHFVRALVERKSKTKTIRLVMPKVQRQARVDELLSLVELEAKRNVLTRYLSGGMKRRLEIARGLMFLQTGLRSQTQIIVRCYIIIIM